MTGKSERTLAAAEDFFRRNRLSQNVVTEKNVNDIVAALCNSMNLVLDYLRLEKQREAPVATNMFQDCERIDALFDAMISKASAADSMDGSLDGELNRIRFDALQRFYELRMVYGWTYDE